MSTSIGADSNILPAVIPAAGTARPSNPRRRRDERRSRPALRSRGPSAWALVAMALGPLAAGCATSAETAVRPPSPPATPPVASTPRVAASSSARLATTSNGPLLVVLDGGSNTGLAVLASGISIIRPTGQVVAHVAITVPKVPAIANCGNLLPVAATIAAGGVYWADSSGVVRRLEVSGAVKTVASLGLGPDEQMSFAVSPDGSQIEATMLYVPPLPPNASLDLPYMGRDPNSVWRNRTLLARTGEPPTVVAEVDYRTSDGVPAPTEIVGWDSGGPLATVGTSLCAQSVPIGRLSTSQLIHLGPGGEHLAPVGGTSCRPLDFIPDGSVLCLDASQPPYSISVRNTSGQTSWSIPGPGCGGLARLAPDGQRVLGITCVQIRDAAGTPRTAPAVGSKLLVGWYTSNVAVTAPNGPGGQLELVDTDDMSEVAAVPAAGAFLGTLPAA